MELNIDFTPVRLPLVQSSPAKTQMYASELFDNFTKFNGARETDYDKLFFVSLTIPPKYKVKPSNIAYGALSRDKQYNFIVSQLTRWMPIIDIKNIVIVFEQSKLQMLHCHMLVHTANDIAHNLRADIACLFGFKTFEQVVINVHVSDIYSKHILDYLFKKTKKAYEEIDQNRYKSLIYDN